jgi:hypothetical protein
LSKNNSSKNNNLNKLIIYYGDFTFKNSALDMISLLKKDIKKEDLDLLQDTIITSLYTLLAPRRNLDFTEL